MPDQEIIVQASEAGQRLDIFLVGHLPLYSRSALQKAINTSQILVNSQSSKPRYTVRVNDQVSIPDLERKEIDTQPVPVISIPVIYEDDDVVVINKPAGVIVHTSTGSKETPSVTDWFLKHYPTSALVGDLGRPGIVHRLDKDTSGVLILAKTQKAFEFLKNKFKKRAVKKEYQALVFGIPGSPDGRITSPIGRSRRNPMRRAIDENGKPSITEWKLAQKLGGNFSLLNVFPYTGRTHQIRVHLHKIGHPVVGDNLYVFKRQRPPLGVTRQQLHASKLTLKLPSDKRKTFQAPLPQDFIRIINKLSNNTPNNYVLSEDRKKIT